MRQKWIGVVQRADWKRTSYSALCSVHFSEDCFDRTSLNVTRLRPNSVPTIFLASPTLQNNLPKSGTKRKLKLTSSREELIPKTSKNGANSKISNSIREEPIPTILKDGIVSKILSTLIREKPILKTSKDDTDSKIPSTSVREQPIPSTSKDDSESKIPSILIREEIIATTSKDDADTKIPLDENAMEDDSSKQLMTLPDKTTSFLSEPLNFWYDSSGKSPMEVYFTEKIQTYKKQIKTLQPNNRRQQRRIASMF